MSTLLIKNGIIATLGPNPRVLHDHALFIEDDCIQSIAPAASAQNLTTDAVVDARGRLVLPGFINAHMHFYSSFARGLTKAAPAHNFPEILRNLWWRLDKKLTLEDCEMSARVACLEAIRHGTTTIMDHHASPGAVAGSLEAVAGAVTGAGLRACLCYELSDRDGPEVARAGIAENIEFIQRCAAAPQGALAALFGLHASFTLSEATLKAAAAAAGAANAGFHIHCAEDASDQEITQKQFGSRVVPRLQRHGILGPKSICAHGVHLSNDEIDLLAQTQTTVVHNAQSNMNNAVGSADVLKLVQRGVRVGLGTDAMTNRMLEEARVALWLQKLKHADPAVGFGEITGALLWSNAQIAGGLWPYKLGELTPGAKADVVVLDYLPATPLDAHNLAGHLIFGVSQALADTTICDGKVLMLHRQFQKLDEERICAQARELAGKLWARF